MADVSKYRKGYEDVKNEIAESRDQSLPEQFVKGFAGLPVAFAREMLRSEDEEQGRHDALEDKSFDPGRVDRKRAAREAEFQRQEAEKEERRRELEEEEEAAEQQRRRRNAANGGGSGGVLGDFADALMGGLIKVALAIVAFIVALIVVFSSAPFWLGGLLAGWLAGFAFGVFRAGRLEQHVLRNAPVVSDAKGRLRVNDAFVAGCRRPWPDSIVPLLLCGLWCGLLEWPLLKITGWIDWAGWASVVAGSLGVILGGLASQRGFRRALDWQVHEAAGLPATRQAGWSIAGIVVASLLLPLLALMGKGLPQSLLNDF